MLVGKDVRYEFEVEVSGIGASKFKRTRPKPAFFDIEKTTEKQE